MLKLILGLGNIGKKYVGTRHNIGFEVVDRVASMLKADWQPREKEYDWAIADMRSQNPIDESLPVPSSEVRVTLLLAKPRTYMNLSGLAAKKLLELHNLTPDQMLVIVDDLALPLGAVRIRGKGSDGGHNGLTSIIEELGTQSFPRIRLGIGQPTVPNPESEVPGSGNHFKANPVDKEEDIIDHVLGKFSPVERPMVDKMIAHAADAVLFVIDHRLEEAMSKYNCNPALPDSP